MQNRQRATNSNNNINMTNCHKGGIKIKDTGNNKAVDPFAGLNPFSNSNQEKNIKMVYDKSGYENLDLNIDTYSREELFKLFGIKNMNLTEDIMKECKKIVLKTHPDKSRLDEKYFIFFGKAYKKIQGIYEFQNKTNSKKVTDNNEYFDSNNTAILDKVFDSKKDLKDPKNFNSWFNEQFDKHKLEDPNETGYGNWLKSDEDIVYTPNVTKSKMSNSTVPTNFSLSSLPSYKSVLSSYYVNIPSLSSKTSFLIP
jgi:hypothetical protein